MNEVHVMKNEHKKRHKGIKTQQFGKQIKNFSTTNMMIKMPYSRGHPQ